MKKIVLIALAFCLLAISCKTRSGETVTVDLSAQDSLAAVRAAQALPEEPVYLLFHRVINGFVIQGGDPFTRDTSLVAQWGEGGPSYTIKAEMRDADGNPLHTHVKGALAAARQGDLANPFKESSGSQFYLVQDPDHCTHLDGEYTVFGETISGLHVIDRIAAQPTDRLDRPIEDVKIITIKPNKELNSK